MKIRIWHKLALVLLLTTTLVISIAFVLAQLSFRQDFSGYIKGQQERQVQLLSERLVENYEQAGSWSFLRKNPRLFRLIIRESFRNEQATFTAPPVRHEKPVPPFDPPPRFRPRHASRMAILDQDKNNVLGSLESGPSIEDFPIKSMSKTIGYIRIRSISNLTNKLDERFIKSQFHSYLGIGVIAFFLSLIAAWLLSNYFRRRFVELTKIANDLTAGQFEQRINITHNDELADLGRNFNVLADTLEKNRYSQKQWIADISHELRTPLAILCGEIEALQDGIRPLDKAAIKSLSGEASHLNYLVNDLYQLSLSDLGKLGYKKSVIDLTEILDRVIAQYHSRLLEHDLNLENRIEQFKPISIFGDEQRFMQLFSNLIDNAIKYTNQGGLIIIDLEQTDHNILLTFEDSTPGLSTENLSKMFNRLYRAEPSRNRNTGGAGLGLAIASAIIEAHGGKISASDSMLGGIKLSIQLPLYTHP